jgi:sugar phosphate isomerase/epimerase
MKIGLYSVTYRGIWYRGEALDLPSLMRLAKQQGWESVELDAERPHAAPMDLSADDRKRLRDLSGTLELPISAISPNCDLSSPVPSQREAMICYVRECITLAREVGAPLCKIFAAWRGITLHDGLATYHDTHAFDQYRFWTGDRRAFVVAALRELAAFAEPQGVVLALQNHGPDIVRRYQDVLALIDEVGSPAFKACLDVSIEPRPDSAEHAWEMARAAGSRQVHSHYNGEFTRTAEGHAHLAGGGYFDDRFWGRQVAYPAYVDALVSTGYAGHMNWEYCHPAKRDGAIAGIEYVHDQTQMALEYMKGLRAHALAKVAGPLAGSAQSNVGNIALSSSTLAERPY